MMLTKEQVAFYHANGYVGVEDVIPAEMIAELRRVTDELVEKSRSVTESDDAYDLEPDHSPETPRVRRFKTPQSLHPIYGQAMCHERVLDSVEQLIGPGVRDTGGGKLNMKSAAFGSPVEWHQDWAFFPHTNGDVLTVGVCIDAMTVENGALLVIPGSHEGPIYDHHQDGHFAGGITDPAFSPEGAVPIELGAGGISIHHVRTLHGSLPNLSDRPRRLLLKTLTAIDAWPLRAAPDWEDWNALILRGESTYEPRMEALPVRLPFPGPERTGSIYATQGILRKSFLVGQD
jgi:ectoine hydroxylase-related dioxygenase (phytanoyl-CoA dioxygenase family)